MKRKMPVSWQHNVLSLWLACGLWPSMGDNNDSIRKGHGVEMETWPPISLELTPMLSALRHSIADPEFLGALEVDMEMKRSASPMALKSIKHWRHDMVRLVVISSSLVTSSAANWACSKLFKVGDHMRIYNYHFKCNNLLWFSIHMCHIFAIQSFFCACQMMVL